MTPKTMIDDIVIDYSRDELFDAHGLLRLKESYMKPEEKSPQERFAFVSKKFSSNLEHAQRLYDYSSKHWLSYSTPILAFGKDPRALPISCYLPYLPDSREGLINTLAETNWLSMLGGGVGVGIGIRGNSEKSTGVISHMKTYDASALAYRQNLVRRGSIAMYLNISHPDVLAFLEMRKPTGDMNQRCLNLHHGINITDDFMHIIEKCMIDPSYDDSWSLIDPHTKITKEVVSAKMLWQKILELRMTTGEPYIHFIDTSNKHLPQHLKDKGLSIKQSNLCLVGDTKIHIRVESINEAFGEESITIKEFVDNWKNAIYTNKTVYVQSLLDQNIVWSEVSNAFCNGYSKELIVLESDDVYLKCTPEHQIFTVNKGYVKAEDLTKDDVVLFHSLVGISVKTKRIEEQVLVYDLTVPETQCFSANGIIVHNCSEIIEPTNEERTAVCCLSSLNLEKYDDWFDNELFINDVVEMLDNALEYFIQNAPDQISRARFSASQERSIGVGALGFHAYLQQHKISFESISAKVINKKIFKHIQEEVDKTNLRLGKERGECPDGIGTGKRLSLTRAVAPNASSSIIMGNTSPSIEPYRANAYRQDTMSGSHTNKNKYLITVIEEYCQKDPKLNCDEIWTSIMSHDGSVSHLEFLTSNEREIFKTAIEIDQRWVIEHAADRQPYIDQAQSLNLFFSPEANIKYLHSVHFSAWKKGLKTLYYCRSSRMKTTDKIGQQIKLEEIDMQKLVDGDECLACQ